MRSRIFKVKQYEKFSETGEFLLTEDRIKVALMSHRTIKRWAYICRDKDVYSAEDEAQNPEHKAGQIKSRYWHIVLESPTNALEMSVIAKWFGVSEKCVETVKGAGAFLKCVQELTYEVKAQSQLGKRKYEDSEVRANFDFRAELDKRTKSRAKNGRNSNERASVSHSVLNEGLQTKKLSRENSLACQKDALPRDEVRYEYNANRAEMPKTRINYYVCGHSVVGKNLISKAIARSLYPDLKDDNDIFFEVGENGVSFDGYAGQPVIIWNDRRSVELLEELGGRGNVFNVFDTHPTKRKANAKNAFVNLCNEVNIVNSVESYKDFLDGLVAEYSEERKKSMILEDKWQSYSRFPLIVSLRENEYDLLINRGLYYGTKEYGQYIEYKNIRGSLESIESVCGANTKLARELERKAVAPVVKKHSELLEKLSKEEEDEAKIRAQFADVGQVGEVVGEGSYIDGKFVSNEEIAKVMREDAKREAKEIEYQAEKERQSEFENSIFSGTRMNETASKISEEASLKEDI